MKNLLKNDVLVMYYAFADNWSTFLNKYFLVLVENNVVEQLPRKNRKTPLYLTKLRRLGVQYQKCAMIANSRKIQKPGPCTVLYKIRTVLMHKVHQNLRNPD